jgi:hypothetical protein
MLLRLILILPATQWIVKQLYGNKEVPFKETNGFIICCACTLFLSYERM